MKSLVLATALLLVIAVKTAPAEEPGFVSVQGKDHPISMFSHSWQWGQSGEIQFLPDGTIKKSFLQQNWLKWEPAKDPMGLRIRGRDGVITVRFSADHARFSGPAWNPKNVITGIRLSKTGSTATVPQPGTNPPPVDKSITAIVSDSSQPRLQVVKEQGPNATEWALTPLDEAIPGDIRQNIMSLREDLLDESQRSPKSSTAAYTLASDYCDKILSILAQREIARVNAGYRSAQADASKITTNQALDARRNYKMSWPQYAREEAQRAALRENETDKADVKKEQLKVEWAARAEQMRLHLDTLYRQLREAMR